jgi:lipoyl(octanoyl) transferase
MAADLACLDAVAEGAPPALRLYQWSPPALSLGRFQPDTDVDFAACQRLGVEVIRRPTGGRALLHGGDLTYSVALPRPPGPAGHIDALYRRIAGALIVGLEALGVRAEIGSDPGPAGPVCFVAAQGADLRVGERKLCGSAQVQKGPVVLQHGSILLERLPFDELDLLLPDPNGFWRREGASTAPGRRQNEALQAARATLRAKSVTLAELGAPTDPAVVAGSIVAGFESTLDLTFESRVESPE